MGPLWSVIWAPFVALGGPLAAFGDHWGSLVASLLEPFGLFCGIESVWDFGLRRTKTKCDLDHIEVDPLFGGSKCTSHKFVYQTFVTKPPIFTIPFCPRKSIRK